MRELAHAYETAEKTADIWTIIITGAGRALCTGADVSLVGATEVDGHPTGVEMQGEPFLSTYRQFDVPQEATPPYMTMTKPVICAVNGVAAGAGANFALQCDFVVAARSAKFLQAFAKLGLVPDAGGTWLLPRLVGSARARGLAMLAEPLSAEDAERWGLIWKCVDDDKLMAEAESICRRLAALPADGITRIKRIMDASETNSHDAQLDLERDTQREAGHDPDFREAVAAFVEKRAPKFKR